MVSDVKRRTMILKGNMLKTVLAICLPLALYQFFNSLYTLFDQVISAQISSDAHNAVSSISQIKSTISAFGGGLAAGGGVIVSRLYGAGNLKDARHASSNLLMISIIMSIILLVILIPLATPIMQLARIAPQSIAIGAPYFRLQMVELIFVSINSVFIGLEKAKGNSKLVLGLNLGIMGVKLGMTSLLVLALNLKSIVFVELSTIIAQALLTVIAFILMFRKQNILRLSVKMFVLKKKYVKPILVLSIPIFLGKFVMSLGKVVVNGMCGEYWNTATDGLIVGTLGVSNNICGLITSPTNSFEEGGSSIASQNLGNRNIRRALRSFIFTLTVSAIISVTGYVLLRFVFINNIVDLFTSVDAKSETYKTMVKEIFRYDSLSIISLGITAAVLGLLYGFGQTGLSTVLNLSRIGSRIIFLLIIHGTHPELSPTLCAGLSMGISNGIILLISIIFLCIFLIKIRIKGYKGMHMSDPEPEVSELVYEDVSMEEVIVDASSELDNIKIEVENN